MKLSNKKICLFILSCFVIVTVAIALYATLQNNQNNNQTNNINSYSSYSSLNNNELPHQNIAMASEASKPVIDKNLNLANKQTNAINNEYVNLWADDDSFIPSTNSSIYINSNDNDLAYEIIDIDNVTTLRISKINSTSTNSTPFDSAGPAPWVNADQSKIKKVIITEPIKPKATIGWFGCTTEKKGKSVLSQINSIEGLNNIDMSEVTNASYMFCGSTSLTTPTDDKCANFFKSMTKVQNAEGICNYTNLNNHFLNKVACAIAPSVKNTSFAFAHNFDNLESYDTSDSCIESGITNASFMFYQDYSLASVVANELMDDSIETVEKMFYQCGALKTIDLYNTDWSSTGAESTDMFKYCWSLEGEQGTKYDKNHSSGEYARTDDSDHSIPGYFSTHAKLEKLAVANPPSKTKYQTGEKLDLSNAEIIAYFSDGTAFNVTDSVTCSPEKFDNVGGNTVTVSYTKQCITKTTEFNVFITPKSFIYNNHKYYPVFPDNNPPENVTFYKEIYSGFSPVPVKTMKDIRDNNIIYYSVKEGASFTAVASLNFTFDDVYGLYGTGKKEVSIEFKAAHLEDDETVLGLSDQMPKDGSSAPIPIINGVELGKICDTYNPFIGSKERDPKGFGGIDGKFWSCWAQNDSYAYFYNCVESGNYVWNYWSRHFDRPVICVGRNFDN